MANPRQGRASQAGFSPRLGARDPRLRANQAGAVTDNDLDQKTIARDGQGRQRIAAADRLSLLPDGATTAQIIAAYNALLRAFKGL